MTPIKDVPLLDTEKAWIIRLFLAGMTGAQIGKAVQRYENAVFKFLKASGYRFGGERPRADDADALADEAREECRAARREWTKANASAAVAPEAPRHDRAVWRYSTGNANGKPVPITLARIRGLQTPVEQGRAYLWSMGGRGRQMKVR